jgi:copper chaperone NosL
MIDFWRWEYDYGHNLDPNAAIIVPGMAYQPPLIGFKQLLNFGAYSIPDIGGWLFIVSGLLMAAAVFLEFREKKKMKKQNMMAIMLYQLYYFLFSHVDKKIQILSN